MTKLYRYFSLLLLVLLASLPFTPAPALAFLPVTGAQVLAPATDALALPSLEDFTRQVNNGMVSRVTGIYVKDHFAFPVTQQPDRQPAFVSSAEDTLTEFRSAASFGSLGFLAHNNLAGAEFSNLENGNLVTVVYGDGHYAIYQVKQVRRLQAIQPKNPYSSFVDLASGKTLTVEALFYETYGIQGQLILQTCIAAEGNDSWGRLFIIAEPYSPSGGKQPLR